MFYTVLDFGPLAVVEAVQIAHQVAGDPADALEWDLCEHGDNSVFLRFAGPSDGDFNNGPAVLLLHHFNCFFYNLLGDVLRVVHQNFRAILSFLSIVLLYQKNFTGKRDDITKSVKKPAYVGWLFLFFVSCRMGRHSALVGFLMFPC